MDIIGRQHTGVNSEVGSVLAAVAYPVAGNDATPDQVPSPRSTSSMLECERFSGQSCLLRRRTR
jgi:hypothetical protein